MTRTYEEKLKAAQKAAADAIQEDLERKAALAEKAKNARFIEVDDYDAMRGIAIVDTNKLVGKGDTIEFEAVCECFTAEYASMIMKALNAKYPKT